jgi:hypothetical protein
MAYVGTTRKMVRRWIVRTNGWTVEPERILTCVETLNAYRFGPAQCFLTLMSRELWPPTEPYTLS